MSGVVSANAAIYITLGQNIGSCLTALLSSAGTSRNAKRASVIHLTFNGFGAVVFGIGMYIISMMRPDIAQSSICLLYTSGSGVCECKFADPE